MSREEIRLTAVVDRATRSFYCSSSAHRAVGTPIYINGRKVCQRCAAERRQVLKEKARG